MRLPSIKNGEKEALNRPLRLAFRVVLRVGVTTELKASVANDGFYL